MQVLNACNCIDRMTGAVVGGCVCLANPKDMAKNWIEANEYIEVLRKTGCFEVP